MAENSRLEELRRRVEKDPVSIAFAQLAEEYRRAGLFEQSVEVCRAGLTTHPGYLSARVTLGRALIELNQLDDARHELQLVLKSAPENLAAIRGMAEIHHRRGELAEALAQYRSALALARNDPDLERTVEELSRQVAPQPRPQPADGLSLEHLKEELLAHSTGLRAVAPTPPPVPTPPADAPIALPQPSEPLAVEYNHESDATNVRAERTIAALEEWLDALNVPRAGQQS
jgi:tetratricopeptide (TPR) repeat protein